MEFRQEILDLLDEDEGKTFDYELKYFSDELYNNRDQLPMLYRYMPANYTSIRGLEKRTLYLSEAGQMNDIFEGLSVNIEDITRNELSELHDLVFLKAFSESFNNLLMWGQYADNYSGICIEYDLRDMIEHKDYYWHLFPVCYRSKRFVGTVFSHYTIKSLKQYRKEPTLDDAEFLRDVIPLYLVKPEEWEYEKEWRIIVPKFYMDEEWEEGGVIDNYEFPYLYSINKRAIDFPYISKVYLGARIPNMQKEHIIEICKRDGIPVFETYPSLSKYEMEYREI